MKTFVLQSHILDHNLNFPHSDALECLAIMAMALLCSVAVIPKQVKYSSRHLLLENSNCYVMSIRLNPDYW
jgi:hypothetical protein